MAPYLTQTDSVTNSLDQETRYYLFGLTEHSGATNGQGHYTAHTLRSGTWYKFDDEKFEKVSWRHAMDR